MGPLTRVPCGNGEAVRSLPGARGPTRAVLQLLGQLGLDKCSGAVEWGGLALFRNLGHRRAKISSLQEAIL